MKASKVLGMGVAAATLVLGSAFTAEAAAQASGSVKTPWQSGSNIYGEATLYGPNALSKLCVYINQVHPMGPDVTLASKCINTYAGTVRVSTTRPNCATVQTWTAATVNGRMTWQASSPYITFC
ncbi:hypothetical protein [Streptomyces peucetius]|uniref:Uncharacterized protein n=1 Tax=Streptomyces peucetius TaxID=1950 RepID=A0ABY6IAV0_STRPE|nr:hypothetical protein [Streptomyces peucetius]UYQ64088.1 hypothetical protein OGH68_23215 [Streptomyces peucetius]